MKVDQVETLFSRLHVMGRTRIYAGAFGEIGLHDRAYSYSVRDDHVLHSGIQSNNGDPRLICMTETSNLVDTTSGIGFST